MVEVGPGTGALTEHAAPLCRKLILVEFDSRLAEYQKERWAGDPHVEVHHADGASWDPRGLFAEAPVTFLGNLPYSAGGAILQNFLSRPSAVERAVVMLQKEFIDRILATPDAVSYTHLVWPLPAPVQLPARHASGQPPGALECLSQSALGL